MTYLGTDASGSVSRLEWRKPMLGLLLASRHHWIQGFVSGKLFEIYWPLIEQSALHTVKVNGRKSQN